MLYVMNKTNKNKISLETLPLLMYFIFYNIQMYVILTIQILLHDEVNNI